MEDRESGIDFMLLCFWDARDEKAARSHLCLSASVVRRVSRCFPVRKALITISEMILSCQTIDFSWCVFVIAGVAARRRVS